MNKMFVLGLFGCAMFGQLGNVCFGQPASSSIMLKGESEGGTLTLMAAPAWNYPYVLITNRPGESDASVLGRLALQLSASSNCVKYFAGNPVLQIRDGGLVLLGEGRGGPAWILGGTDKGFNIPLAPIGLSVSYQSSKIVLKWLNQPGGYDSIGVFYFGLPVARLPGTATEFTYVGQYGTGSLFASNDITFLVVASKGGVPSNGSGIRFRNNTQQESLMNVPFTQGLAPSFQSWTAKTPEGNVELEQGNLPDMYPGAETRLFNGKGFYQILKGNGTFSGGVSRRFIGLTPGHTYRIGARMNTLETKEGAWSFSFHAAYNPSGTNSLSPEQMAGKSELPDHTKGPTAGQIAKYDSSTATKGAWVTRSSNSEGPGKSIGDITLPDGCDSITTWFRLQGEGVTSVSAGLDSVTIEEVKGNSP